MATPTIENSADETLRVERDAGVVTVTINRPEKKNAMTMPMFARLGDIVHEIAGNPHDRVVILTGAGGNFCSGADLWAERPGPELAMLTRMRRLGEVVVAFGRLPQPVIAKVRGIAAGGGLSLALGADLCVAARSARFSAIFARRGLTLDLGSSWLLPRQIGLQRAKELALFADIHPAEELHRMGLLNRVVDDGELDAFVAGWAARLAAGPPIAMAQTKFLLNDAHLMSLTQAIDAEGAAQTVNNATEDTAEAIRAFVDRREPRFHGR